jgi:hydroxymethylglutaryl-CoA lyase
MSDLPRKIQVNEEGPREGFQFEKGPIPTVRKIELIDSLSETGLNQIQVVSFVNPRSVPGMADAEAVVQGFRRRPGVRYTALWLNEKGLERALATGRLDIKGTLSLTASEIFLKRNQNRSADDDLSAERGIAKIYKERGVPVERTSIRAAFGCNYEGDIAPTRVVKLIGDLMNMAAEFGFKIKVVSLADTMAWATPASVKRLVGAVREAYPTNLEIALHLHDTRGMGIANVYAGLEMGVAIFDSSVAGLGGCPFAGHKGAAGNVCTEDLVFMCDEMGIETGVDLESLINSALLAESVVGHPLPGSVMRGGSLARMRTAVNIGAFA